MPKGLGTVQKKVLLLLYGGLSLGVAGTPGKQMKIIKLLGKEWEKINRDALNRAIRSLYRSKLVEFRELGGDRVKMVLSDTGKKRVLEYNIDTLKIKKPEQWDRRWRIVIFDIPRDKKKVREVFRRHLRRLGFHQLQKSVFVLPYPCENEIEFLIELYEARPYVRQIIATDIDTALHLKHIFGLR